jgi:hypothetical protein
MTEHEPNPESSGRVDRQQIHPTATSGRLERRRGAIAAAPSFDSKIERVRILVPPIEADRLEPLRPFGANTDGIDDGALVTLDGGNWSE